MILSRGGYLTSSLPRSGRPTEISDYMAINLVQKVQKHLRLTRAELHKDLQASETNASKDKKSEIILFLVTKKNTPLEENSRKTLLELF